MGYNSSTGKISGNVTIPDVQKALYTSANDVIVLCKHPNINKYSRYKPYAFGGILPNGLYNGNTNPIPGGDAEELIRDNNFGMEPTLLNLPSTNTSISDVITKWKQWRAPNGLRAVDSPTGLDEPCRLGDFLGYDSKAMSYLADYKIFGDIKDDWFHPIRNGVMGVRLTIDSRSTGSSITPSECKFKSGTLSGQSIDLGNTYLTIVIANRTNKGRFLIAQSEKTVQDAFIESLWNTNTKQGSIEARMDLSNAPSDLFLTNNQGFGQATDYVFLAIGFAEPLSPAYQTRSINNVYLTVKSGEAMPFSLINIDMWDDGWKVAALDHGFVTNFDYKFFFDVPFSASGSTLKVSSVSASGGNININISGSHSIESLFCGTEQYVNDYYTTLTNEIGANAVNKIKNIVASRRCNIGLIFTVTIGSTNSFEQPIVKKYGIFMPDGFAPVVYGSNQTLSGIRGVTFNAGNQTFSPTLTTAQAQQISLWNVAGSEANTRRNACDYFQIEQFPSDSSTIKIPYIKNEGFNFSKLHVSVDCEIVAYPYRDSTEYWMPIPLAEGIGAWESKNLYDNDITVS